MVDVEYLIIGGGPCGIGAARRLVECGQSDVLVLERSDVFGGLAGSETVDGFTWDYGCHVQHSHYDYFDKAMTEALGEDGWLWHNRESWVRMDGRWVPYPFQNNIHRLSEADCARCLEGLREVHRLQGSYESPPENFDEWAQRTFGEGIYELFFKPYNFKVWAYPLTTMGWSWIGDRVSVPDLSRVEGNVAENKDDKGWGPNSTFRYPKRGGAGAVWRALAKQLPDSIKRTNATVVSVDLQGHCLTLSDGETVRYKQLLSTMPLDLLAKATGEQELISAAEGLVSSVVHVVGLGMNGTVPDDLAGKAWVYFPEDDAPFNRATMYSNYSPYNVPDHTKHWSLILEVAQSSERPVNRETLTDDVIAGCVSTGMLKDKSEVCKVWVKTLDHGYPTPSMGRDAALAALRPALEAHDVASRGRFGIWKYEVSNQDHTFMQGVEWADRLLGNIDPEAGPEPTVNRSTWVNVRSRG
ncbi:MAG: protoporphyrinogen oxidase [Pseudohongiellaceae bacterium]